MVKTKTCAALAFSILAGCNAPKPPPEPAAPKSHAEACADLMQLYPRLSPAQREMAMEVVRAKCLYRQQPQPTAPAAVTQQQQLF